MKNSNVLQRGPSEQETQAFLVKAAQDRLVNFYELAGSYDAVWFQEYVLDIVQGAIEKAARGEKARVILTIPPRHTKTTMTSVFSPAWALGKFPQLKFILSTYGIELSEKIGLLTRDLIKSDAYRAIFPEVKLRQDQKAKAKWMTNKGGGFLAVGIGSAVTGSGADVILVDDPHKSREEAESRAESERVWEYYRSTLYSRLEGYGAVVVIMQRWNNHDLVARLLEDMEEKRKAGEVFDEWEIINFPAIAPDDEYIGGNLVRKAGEPLWKEKFPIPVLENIKSTSGLYNWLSQYQQTPIAAENQEFKESLFKYYEPEMLQGRFLKFYTLVDPAISQKREADNTVVLTVAKEINGPNIFRIREDAGHYTPSQTVDLIFLHQAEYKSTVYIETVQYQQALKYAVLEEQRKKEVYFPVHELKTNSNKEIRIRGLVPLYEAGVVFHNKQGDLRYEEELLTFPRGRRDDRIDCMSFILSALENTRGKFAKTVKSKFKGYFGSKY